MTIQQIDSIGQHHVQQLHVLYQNEWWSEDRELPDILEMLRNTPLVIGLIEEESEQLVGFTRVLTDFVYHAMIFDIIVHPDYRSRGLGRRLMQAIVDHPRLARVNAYWLCCLPEMVPFYKKFAFDDELGQIKWMRCIPDDDDD